MLDQCSDGDTGLVEEAVIKRACMLAGFLTADLSACLWGMHALGTQTQRSAPWGDPSPSIQCCVCVKDDLGECLCVSCHECVIAAHVPHNIAHNIT